MIGMARQAGIVHFRDLRALGAPRRDFHRVFVLPLHSDVDRFQPPLEKPAREWIRRLTPHHHLLPNFIDEWLVAAHHAGEDIVMSVQIFGGRVDDNVDAVLDGAEVDGTRECRVDYKRYSLRVREALERIELEHPAGRIYWRFEKDHPRRFSQSFSPPAWLEWIDECDFDPHSRDVFAEEFARSPVNPGAGDEVVSRAEQSEHCTGSRAHSAG